MKFLFVGDGVFCVEFEVEIRWVRFEDYFVFVGLVDFVCILSLLGSMDMLVYISFCEGLVCMLF